MGQAVDFSRGLAKDGPAFGGGGGVVVAGLMLYVRGMRARRGDRRCSCCCHGFLLIFVELGTLGLVKQKQNGYAGLWRDCTCKCWGSRDVRRTSQKSVSTPSPPPSVSGSR